MRRGAVPHRRAGRAAGRAGRRRRTSTCTPSALPPTSAAGCSPARSGCSSWPTRCSGCRSRCCAGAGGPGLLNARVVDGGVVRAGDTVVVADTGGRGRRALPGAVPGTPPQRRPRCRPSALRRGQLDDRYEVAENSQPRWARRPSPGQVCTRDDPGTCTTGGCPHGESSGSTGRYGNRTTFDSRTVGSRRPQPRGGTVSMAERTLRGSRLGP